MKFSAMSLTELGWSPPLQAEWDEIGKTKRDNTLRPARVCRIERGVCQLLLANRAEGALSASVAGSLFRADEGDIAVGDWVAVRIGANNGSVIRKRLVRKSALHRKVAGARNKAQVIAANLDYVLVVTACDLDFNPRRIERYVTAVRSGGATPVVVLNKVDRCESLASFLDEAKSAASGGDAIAVSATEQLGLEQLNLYLFAGSTLALVGSSGVGKSTLVNTLMTHSRVPDGAVQPTRELGVDGKGQHTTTARQMFALSDGAFVIDTPGMREFGLWAATETALKSSFSDVETLASQCKFRNCGHLDDLGCAIRAAIDTGELSEQRLNSYHKLTSEIEKKRHK